MQRNYRKRFGLELQRMYELRPVTYKGTYHRYWSLCWRQAKVLVQAVSRRVEEHYSVLMARRFDGTGCISFSNALLSSDTDIEERVHLQNGQARGCKSKRFLVMQQRQRHEGVFGCIIL